MLELNTGVGQTETDAKLTSGRAIQQIASWILMPLPAMASAFVIGSGAWWIYALCSVALGALVLASGHLKDSSRDYLISFAFVAHCVLLTSSMAGHAWQIDTHMLFFAVLAIVSTLGSARALLFATGLVALHHLSFSILMPSLVYPMGGLVENLQRTVLHAAIVILETGVLLLSLLRSAAADRALQQQTEAAADEAHQAAEAKRDAERSKRDSEVVVTVLSEHLEALAKGRLDCQITRDFPPEYARLHANFNEAINKMKTTISDVLGTTASINNGAMSISDASDDLSARTESQAATLEETAAALEELTTSVKSAAEGARGVENTMIEARGETQATSQIVTRAVDAMTAIENSSNQISQIISVIDDIAFQTNLLALNAGVEAARAGESGRGFAVVASEVRALAQRSSDAATEIKTLIQESSQEVERGVDLVGQAGDSITSIAERVNEVSSLITGIANGAAEQSTGISEINAAMSQLDQVTQQNAAMVENAKSAGHLLSSDSSKLTQLMGRFEVGSASDAAPAQNGDNNAFAA